MSRRGSNATKHGVRLTRDEYCALIEKAEPRAKELLDTAMGLTTTEQRSLETVAYMIAIVAVYKTGGFCFGDFIENVREIWHAIEPENA